MATPISQLKATAAELAARIVGAGLLVWNETAKRWHGGDGVTMGGIAMARYDERNDGSLGYMQRVETDAANAVTIADLGKVIIGNRATAIAFNLDPAADLTAGFVAAFKNINAGVMTIAPNGAELIDGANTALSLQTGASVVIKCDGTSFRSFFSTSEVVNKVAKAGDTMDGQLVLPASTTGLAGLRIPDGVAPSAPGDGDIWRRDADGGLFLRKGGASVKIIDAQQKVTKAVALLTDTKAQNAASQTIPAATWSKRNLNTENYDPDGIVSLSSDEFALVSGSDYLCRVVTPITPNGSTASRALVRLFNVTDSVVVQSVTDNYNANASGITITCVVEAVLAGGKTYRVEHYQSGSSGVRNPVNQAGLSEVYLNVIIERLTNGFA